MRPHACLMFRRAVITGLLSLTAAGAVGPSHSVRAQSQPKKRGLSIYDFPVESIPWFADLFRRDLAFLASRGWRYGENLDWTWESLLDPAAYHARLTSEFAKNPDVVFCGSNRLLDLIGHMEKRIPILCFMSEEIGQPFVGEWRRPKGNVTGIVTRNTEVSQKQFQTLLDVAPQLERIVVLHHDLTARVAGGARINNLLESAQRSRLSRSIDIVSARFGSAAELDTILSDLREQPLSGLFVDHDWPVYPFYPAIAAGAIRAKVPAIFGEDSIVRSGGLISLNVDTEELRRIYLDQFLRIFRGVPVSDIPAVFPNGYRMSLNLKTARAIDLAVSPTIVARADEVIE